LLPKGQRFFYGWKAMRMIKGVVGGEVKNSPRRAKPRLSNPAPATKEWSIVASKRAAIFLWLEGYADD
jgi:hypothetical protein